MIVFRAFHQTGMCAQKNVRTALTKLREIIEKNKSAAQENLIFQLNPVIRGWANYHRHCVAKHAFARMDFEIWRKLWWWSYRRHPQKNATWVKHRYYHAIGDRTWRFAARTATQSSLGAVFMEATALCGEYTHTTTPQDQRGGQPLRSTMAFVFRAKRKRFDGTITVADDRLSTPEGLHMA